MNATALTTETAQAVFEDDAELGHGFGYIGGRRHLLDSTDPECPARPELVAAVDAQLAAYFVAEGWTVDEVFAWADSKLGRWFADAAFSGATFERCLGWNLLVKVEA